MGLNYYASSPTVVLPPQQPQSYFSAHQRAHSPSAMGSYRRKCPTPPSMNYLAAVSNVTAGRKRSITDVDDPEENAPSGSIVIQAPTKPKAEPIHGPGMTLIYPGEPGFSIAAESQTGTWREEKEEKEEQAQPVRPIAASRKSQRMDSAVDIVIPSLDEMASANIIDEHGNTVDSLIASLGVGWKKVMSNPNLRDAARAYARVIENHFDLTDAAVMLEKESLSAYLVRAKQHGVQGYWLFADSLQWCQLVGWSLQRTVTNLMAGPIPRVEGERISARSRTPSEPATPPATDIDMSVTAVDADAMEM
ncbi:hypothetical protein P154DRAFT_516880 [Amniculicola lignicola CBS 123094]|uniref:Uncharacterized protein n=1 Tax=Amniculicola lignicola CBS 123094 TaxID=1392246 RepID=A0A6A5X5C2_9PLEO|nr:hypothetical protein P154DRAFT_516880 [Amniculicola lignicola CBS 123094]